MAPVTEKAPDQIGTDETGTPHRCAHSPSRVMNKPIDMLYVFGLIRQSARHLSLTSTGS